MVQVFILDALADYEPLSPTEARGICERVQLRLQSGNAAVVLSAVKVCDDSLCQMHLCSVWRICFFTVCCMKLCRRQYWTTNLHSSTITWPNVQIIVKCIEYVQDQDFEATTTKRLAGPLVTLLSLDHELQYVTLRNIILLLQVLRKKKLRSCSL